MCLCLTVKNDANVLDLNALLQESSQCQVPELARPCFQAITVKMSAYDEKFCAVDTSDDENKDGAENVPPCMLIHQVRNPYYGFLSSGLCKNLSKVFEMGKCFSPT